jgi:hypothetical protein
MSPEWEREVRELGRRVSDIERRLGMNQPEAGAVPAAAVQTARTFNTSGLAPALGQSLLGLAGAYLLRALSDSTIFSPPAMIALGIVYAMGWLAAASRTAEGRPLEAGLRSLTAVLILAPLLWEAVFRFEAISHPLAAAILAAFTFFGLAISWRKNLLLVATIATLAGLGVAAALLVATRDVLPFTFVILAIAAMVETSACLDHWLSERWLAAAVSDLAVVLATWLVTNARGLPEGYAPIPPAGLLAAQIGLLGIYLSGTIVRTLVRGLVIRKFEILQCALAFLVAVSGGVHATMAVLFLVCAAACYAVAFALLDRAGARGRNFYTYSTFGILLALAGTRILLTDTAAGAIWSTLAVGCVGAGAFFSRLTLQVHGAVYLLLGLLASGALAQAEQFLLGTGTWPGDRPVAIALGVVGAAGCYILATRAAAVLRLGLAGAAAWLVAGVAAGTSTAIYHAILGADASHSYCATMRTSILAISAVALVWAAAHWKAPELSRLMWAAMALGAYRLAFLDLREDSKVALVLSLLIYGAVLTLIPKMRLANSS